MPGFYRRLRRGVTRYSRFRWFIVRFAKQMCIRLERVMRAAYQEYSRAKGTMMPKFYGALMSALALAACSGGGSGGSSGGGGTVVTPTPTPTPIPTPTPTPSPTFSYTKLADLTGNWSFQSACSRFGANKSVPPETIPYGSGPVIAYDAATQSLSIAGAGLDSSFGPVDWVAANKRYQKSVSGTEYILEFFTPYERPAPAMPTDSDYSGGYYSRGYTLSIGGKGVLCVYGTKTASADISEPGLLEFKRGSSQADAEQIYGANAFELKYYMWNAPNITFDSATGKVGVKVTILGMPTFIATRYELWLGEMSGEAVLNPETGTFEGEWTSAKWDNSNQGAYGRFSGAFFGPAKKEVMIAYDVHARHEGSVSFVARGVAGAFR
jgi:hypothetical protein